MFLLFAVDRQFTSNDTITHPQVCVLQQVCTQDNAKDKAAISNGKPSYQQNYFLIYWDWLKRECGDRSRPRTGMRRPVPDSSRITAEEAKKRFMEPLVFFREF